MADLSEIDRAEAVKLAGANPSTGVATNFAQVDANGNVQVIPVSAGPVTPGAVASNSDLVGGQYNSSLPTLSSGQQSALQIDASGRVIIRPLTSADVVTANQGTSPWVTRDQADGVTGSVVPSETMQVGGSDGTNLRTIATDTSGRQKLAAASYFHPVYSARVQSVTAVTTVLSTSLSATIAATKAGNTLVVIAAVNAGTLTITDSASQSYSTATSIAGNGTQTSKIFYFPNTAAGVTSVTISSTSSTDLNMVVVEYTGLLTASSLDQTSTHGQTATTSWTSNPTTATAQASELLIGSVMGTLHNNSSFTGATGWNSIATVLNIRGGANLELNMQDQLAVATGTYAFTGTISQNDNAYAAIATFKFVTPNMIITTNSPVIIKSGAGILRRVVLNTIGTGSANVIFYDNTTNSGTVIATLTLTGAVTALVYDLYFTTGLTMVVNSTSPDFTVMYE